MSTLRGRSRGHRAASSSGREALVPRSDSAELRAQRDDLAAKNRRVEELEEELARAEGRYADLYQKLPIPYCTLDASGVITDLNSRFAKMLGRERDGMIGRPFVRRVADEDRGTFFGHMRRCRHERSVRTALRILREGERVPVELVSEAMSPLLQESPRFSTVMIDLTEKRRDVEAGRVEERERRRGEARDAAARATGEARERFLAELSHELRTPLTPILATVNVLREREDVPRSVRASLEIVQRNVEVEARLIDDLLDVSRIATDRLAVELSRIDAHHTIREVVVNLSSEIERAGVVFHVDLGARHPCVLGDAVRLSQVFSNLVVNALRNTPAGGEILISTANIGNDLRIIVRDTGVGIDPDRLEEIFSPFSRAQDEQRGKGGLGLGLSIVRGLVEAHKGRILALSRGRGEGAAFVVELPDASGAVEEPAAAEPADVAREPRARESAPVRVLLVEDHPDTRLALQTLLKVSGYEVLVAEDIASAVQRAREPFDVLVCDIGLPDGTGIDLVQRIRRSQPVKAIALSGYGSPRDVDLAAEAGFAMHLTKPIGAEQLIEAIDNLVR